MNQAEFEARQQEFDEKARAALAYVKAVREGTDEESVQRRKEEEAKQKEREARLEAAAVLEKRIACIKPQGCPLITCTKCEFYTPVQKRVEALQKAVQVLRAEEEA